MVGTLHGGELKLVAIRGLGESSRVISRGQVLGSWSPDGSQVAAVHQAGRILLAHQVTGERRSFKLEGSYRWIHDVDWAPSGNLLLLVTEDSQGRSALWSIRPDGTGQRRLLEDKQQIVAARWCASRDSIYYFRSNGATKDLWKIPVAAGAEAQGALLLSGLETDGDLSITRDGRRLVHRRELWHSNLWLATPSGSGKNRRVETRALTSGTSHVERPSVSPDGSRVVFNMGRYPQSDLYTIPITGGTPKPLTSSKGYKVGAVWSADGRQVAFASVQAEGTHVWIVDASGGTPRSVSRAEVSDTYNVVWAPGAEILYHKPGNRNYWIVEPNGGEERPLVPSDATGWVFSPVWSPDRTRVALAWNRRPTKGLWVRSVDGSSERFVSTSEALPLAWSQDGAWIYGIDGGRAAYRPRSTPWSETLSDARIVAIRVASGESRTLAELPFREVGSAAVTPDGRTVVCAVYESQSDTWLVENFDPEAKPPRNSR